LPAVPTSRLTGSAPPAPASALTIAFNGSALSAGVAFGFDKVFRKIPKKSLFR
jgi:hypothetical protein